MKGGTGAWRWSMRGGTEGGGGRGGGTLAWGGL